MITTRSIRDFKGRKKICCLSAYDALFSKILAEAGLDIILVGDSLGNVVLGYPNTLPVTMEDMLRHVQAVHRGAPQTFVVADMPFMSFQDKEKEALGNAARFIKEAGANAVKVEGANHLATINKIIQAGIPVMGHLGFTPQSIHQIGGPYIQGKDKLAEEKLIKDAKALEKIGVFAIVLELVPEVLAQKITQAIAIPTIGIGAGRYVDGQILVLPDLLGLTEKTPRFVKQYAGLRQETLKAVKNYIKEVENSIYPSKDFSY